MQEKMISLAMQKGKRLFFVGIGGIGMSSLAMLCHGNGYFVCGSDKTSSPMTERLRAAGIPVFIGHRKEQIEGCDTVIYTGAVGMENPELAAAIERRLPILRRAELLGYVMREYPHRIGVAGMHGKSTATAMLAHLFMTAGKKPTVVCGAETREMGGAYTVGEGEHFIFEACEYQDAFLSLCPTVSVLLNIDLDHTDYFTGGLPQITDSFRTYAALPYQKENLLPATVANADDEKVMEAVTGIKRLVTFGICRPADYGAILLDGGNETSLLHELSDAPVSPHAAPVFPRKNDGIQNGVFEEMPPYSPHLAPVSPSFVFTKKGVPQAHITLSVHGEHNIYNALAAAAVGDILGLSPAEIASGLSTFSGLSRRFELRGNVGGASVFVDYAHHPREIEATIAAARKVTSGRLLCVFEPHTYSRTASLWEQFKICFKNADELYLLDIYAAREVPIDGITSKRLAAEIEGAKYLPSYEAATSLLKDEMMAGDTLLILGAGTVNTLADLIL